MIKLNSELTRGLDLFKNNNLSGELHSNKSRALGNASEVTSFQHSQQQSFTFFYRSVHSKLEQALDAKTSKLEQELAEKQLAERDERASTAANNILKFVELQLQKDVADGSTPEQLESRINAALEGFEQGYGEATDALGSLNLMSEDLQSEIALTKDKVLAGIEQFKVDYLGQEASEPVTEETEPEVSSPSRTSEAAYLEKQSAGLANDFSFELTTRDGDKVTVNASMLMAQSREFGAYSASGQGQSINMAYMSEASYRESNFAFSVDGDLDQDELKAINNLLNQVNDLAVDFYQGDVNKAFDKALELNYNSEEISSFSVSLTQVKNFTAYQAYQTDKPVFNANAINQLKPLADFTSQLVGVEREVENLFSHPRELLSDVLQQINQLQQPQDYPSEKLSFNDFANRLLDNFSQLLDNG